MVWRQLRRPALLYGLLALLLLWFSLRQLSLREIGHVLGQLQLQQLLALALLNLLVLATMVLRWQLLLDAEGYRLPFWSLFVYRLAAFGVTYFTPGPQFGGEPVQVYLVKERHGVRLPSAIAAVTVDKVLEMLVNFTVLVGGALLLLQQGALPSQVGYQSLSLAVLLLSIPLFLFLAFVQGKAPLSRIFAFLQIYVERHPLTGSWFRHSAEVVADSEQQVIHLCRHHPRAVLGALLITLIGWSVIICEFAYAAHILGAMLQATDVIMILMTMRVAILLPMPAGIGTLETSLVLAFRFLHLDPTVGLALSLVIRTRDILLGGLGLWLGGTTVWSRGPYTLIGVGKRQPTDSKASIW